MLVMDERPIGLIAGEGCLPVKVAEGIRAAGRRVACVGLRDQYVPELPGRCDAFKTAGVIQIGRWIRLLRRFGAREAVMIGRVQKVRMYQQWHLLRQMPDWRAARLWFGKLRHDRRSHAILTAVADELAAEGITLIDSTSYIGDQMADEGVMTRRGPTAAERGDIEFALPIVREVAAMDIGQAIAVRDREVIAVEAVEGTNRMIERAGALCRRGGWTLIKLARPEQDMRFDVPTVGLRTIELMREHGGACVAVEAGRVIMAEKAKIIAAADAAGIAVVGVRAASAGADSGRA